MAVNPEVLLVVHYDYLWKSDDDKGRIESDKPHPAMIVQARDSDKFDGKHVYFVAISHTPPKADEGGVEIPQQVARKLGLDHERMWIKTHEINHTKWENGRFPFGIENNRHGEKVYGMMRHDVGKKAYEQVAERIRNRTLVQVNRDDEMPARKPESDDSPRQTRQQTRVPQNRTNNPRGRGGNDRSR